MKLILPEALTTEDISAVTLGLYHLAKSNAVTPRDPQNSVEFTLQERSKEYFQMYLDSLNKSFEALMEKI